VYGGTYLLLWSGSAGSGPAPVTGTLASTLGTVTLAGTGTATEPSASIGTLAVTFGAMTLVGAGTAAAAGATIGSLAATLDALALAGTGTVVSPASSTGTLTSTLGVVTLVATATATDPGAIAGTLSATLGSLTLAGAGTATIPPAAVGSLAANLGAFTLAGIGVATAPGTVTGTMAAQLGSMTLAAAGTSVGGVVPELPTAIDLAAWFWWISGSASPTVVGARNLLVAIQARYRATPDLAAALPGGLWRGLADEDTPTPYGEIHVIAAPIAWNTGPWYRKDVRLQISLFGEDVDELERIQELFEDTFYPRMSPPLALTTGHLVTIRVDDGFGAPDQAQAETGRPLHQHVVLLSAKRTRRQPQ
jgi:hypothetical protein